MEFIMNNFIKHCKEFMQDEEGLTIVEYVVGAALLVVAFTAADPWSSLSTSLSGVVDSIETDVAPAE